MRIRHLFISPGHNYFGHHGLAPGEHGISEVRRIECVAGSGIRGDRFFGYKPDYKGQITFFAWEDFVALRRELGLPDAHPSALRRNVITEDLDLPSLVGRSFVLGDVEFLGVEECRPCYWMDAALGPGAEAWLKGRGGLRAKILGNGTLEPGEVAWVEPAAIG